MTSTRAGEVRDLGHCVADQSGLPRERLGVIAGLFVPPEERGVRAGGALHATAAAAARARGLLPVLDVATTLESAVALYDAAGWTRAARVEVGLADGAVLDERVFPAPETGAHPRAGSPGIAAGR